MKVGGYEIERELGRGGMGVVYLARDPHLDRQVALKLLLGQPDAEGLARFRREAEALGALEHPAVVSVHGAGEDQGRPFLVLEYVAGRSLAQVLRHDGPLPPERAARLVADIARGVAHAHTKGILHRDIKPENVLVGDRGQARLTDFGLARLAQQERLTQTGSLLGTPDFMAPEQASGQVGECSPLTDVHGLGALLHALLAGEAPFGGQTLANVLNAVLTLPPRALPRDVPEDLRRICGRCLQKRPQDRYPSALDVAADLERFLSSPRSSRARGGRLVFIAASLAAALVGAILAGRRAGPRADPPSAARPSPQTRSQRPASETSPPAPGPSPSPTLAPSASPSRPEDSEEQALGALLAAQVLLMRGEPEQALRQIEVLLAGGPRADALVLRGDALVACGTWADGIPDYAAAVELAESDETRAVAATKLSTALRMTKGRRQEALAHAERAVELGPERAQAWDVLAHARSVMGDWSGALEAWARSLELDAGPDNRADILRNQGRALHETGRYEEALERLDASYAVDPKPLTLLQRARALEQLKRPRLALEAVQRALSVKPDVGGENTQRLLRRLEAKVAALPSPAEVDPHR